MTATSQPSRFDGKSDPPRRASLPSPAQPARQRESLAARREHLVREAVGAERDERAGARQHVERRARAAMQPQRAAVRRAASASFR